MKRILISFLLILVIVPLVTTPALAGARASTPTPDPSIQFGETEIINDLPKGYAFETTVESPGFNPVRGNITLTFTDDWIFTSNLAIDTANPRNLSYFINAVSQDIYPFTPFQVEWTVTDAQGKTATSGQQTVTGYDPRFEWQVMKSGQRDLTIYYHDRDSSFGDLIFDAAERSANFMEEDFDLQLTGPITVVIYNSGDEVIDYYTYFDENTGGIAVSDLGLTIQIIEDYYGMEDWINEVMPHEISHLYFHQAINGQAAPTWLNEGLAQVNEFGLSAEYLSSVNEDLKYLEPLPDLKRLESNFDSGQWSHSDYEMAYSLVSYIISTYGKESIHAILTKYANGSGREKAFKDVLGVDFPTLYGNWIEASGLSQDSPTSATRTPASLPTPTLRFQPEGRSDVVVGVVAGLVTLGICAFVLLIAGILLLIIFSRRRKNTPSAESR